ncbi:polyadenylate-binding protein 2 isoform X2 [Varanus komodoensis]|uniref:RRM domain-containing protein n=1 Tax=Varanus komodoensis TaxID=61221 RepID=A0A8D2JEP9_VARKO|nr:polyadenylate-binding protein 2 isoform X2 [Varanus komodoensis]
MEEEAEKLKELQNEVEKQMNMSPPPGNAGPVIMSLEEKMEADARSIYVGNVDYGATAEELEAHFHGCGSVNRVTILCDKYTGHPKGFAYIEFSDKESVRTSLALDESLFRGRQIKVIPKRTNRPGISTTDRGFPRTRYRGRGSGYSSSRARFYSGFSSRPPRGRAYRSDPLLSLGWGCGGSAAQRRWAAHGWRRASALRAGGRIPGCPGPKATWQAKEVGWELQPLVLAKDSLSAETTVRWKRTVQIGRELGH